MLSVREVIVNGERTGMFEAELSGIGKVGVQVAPGVAPRTVSVIFSREEWSLEVAVPAADAVEFAQRLLDAARPIGTQARRGGESITSGGRQP